MSSKQISQHATLFYAQKSLLDLVNGDDEEIMAVLMGVVWELGECFGKKTLRQ